jgi:heme exporter protein CcmD
MDKYIWYVVASYASTIVLVGGLIIATVVGAARARRELEDLDRSRDQ